MASTGIELKRPGAEDRSIGFADAEAFEQFVGLAGQPEEEGSALAVYAAPDSAEANVGEALPLTVQQEDNETAAVGYAGQQHIDRFMSTAEAVEDNQGLMMYADEAKAQEEEGNTVILKVQLDGEDEMYLVYANADKIGDFLANADQEDRSGMMIIYATEEIAEQDEVATTREVILWQREERRKFRIFSDETEVDDFLTLAEELDTGANMMVYVDENEASLEGERISEILVKRLDDNEVFVGHVEEEQLEQFAQAADPHSLENELDDLTRKVYGQLRHRLSIERERRRYS